MGYKAVPPRMFVYVIPMNYVNMSSIQPMVFGLVRNHNTTWLTIGHNPVSNSSLVLQALLPEPSFGSVGFMIHIVAHLTNSLCGLVKPQC